MCVCVCVRVSVCVPMKVAFDERVYLFLGLGMEVLELMHRTTANTLVHISYVHVNAEMKC